MFEFIVNNIPSIIVGTLIALGLVVVVLKMIRDKKRGKSSCGCNCKDCPSAGICHTDPQQNIKS